MVMASSTEGWSTVTGVKRRSRAGSFSMNLRYSSKVVAPIVCSSPRASMGFKMLEASMLLSTVEPAPTIMWISSMKRMMFLSRVTVSTIFLRRSSKSPRYLAPATRAVTFREYTVLPRKSSGTSPCTIASASPSTTALLPTPGSPMSTGLFLVRRDKICTTFSISSCLPMTGSSLPRRAFSVRSSPYAASSGLSELSVFSSVSSSKEGAGKFSSARRFWR